MAEGRETSADDGRRQASAKGAARQDRLAEALRANLRRRKDQARARKTSPPPEHTKDRG